MSIHNGHILLGISFQNYSKDLYMMWLKNWVSCPVQWKLISYFEDMCIVSDILKAIEDMDEN